MVGGLKKGALASVNVLFNQEDQQGHVLQFFPRSSHPLYRKILTPEAHFRL
jgi:hypothetical protein